MLGGGYGALGGNPFDSYYGSPWEIDPEEYFENVRNAYMAGQMSGMQFGSIMQQMGGMGGMSSFGMFGVGGCNFGRNRRPKHPPWLMGGGGGRDGRGLWGGCHLCSGMGCLLCY